MPYEPFDLSGKTALITGCNSVLCLGMATALADAGAAVCIWGTNPSKNESALSELQKRSDNVHAILCDVSNELSLIHI